MTDNNPESFPRLFEEAATRNGFSITHDSQGVNVVQIYEGKKHKVTLALHAAGVPTRLDIKTTQVETGDNFSSPSELATKQDESLNRYFWIKERWNLEGFDEVCTSEELIRQLLTKLS